MGLAFKPSFFKERLLRNGTRKKPLEIGKSKTVKTPELNLFFINFDVLDYVLLKFCPQHFFLPTNNIVPYSKNKI